MAATENLAILNLVLLQHRQTKKGTGVQCLFYLLNPNIIILLLYRQIPVVMPDTAL